MTSTGRILGVSALVGGGIAVLLGLFLAALLIGPFVFWIAWNVLDFAAAVGLPELGFWSIVLTTLFLIVGWCGKALITAIVFIVDPAWLHGAAQVHWPEPSVANFFAIVLLAILASRPHAHAHKRPAKTSKKKDQGSEPWATIAREITSEFASAAAKHREGAAPH